MKLFLTSAGFSNEGISKVFLEQLSNPVSESTVLIVAYTQNPREEFYVQKIKEELQGLGFKDIAIANMNSFVKVSSLGTFDVIYVCGGNTFSILNKLRVTGLDAFIIQQVKAGTVYVGVSAGSIITGPSIEIAGSTSEGDLNEIGLQDLTGFNLVDFEIFPHFHEELRGEVEDIKKKAQYKIFEITDSQAVFVNGSEVTFIGKP
jgi:dipeptidase E